MCLQQLERGTASLLLWKEILTVNDPDIRGSPTRDDDREQHTPSDISASSCLRALPDQVSVCVCVCVLR